jgi:Dyp-type peroxidase family
LETLELDDIQGLIRHGYPYFKAADYLLLRFDDVAGTKRWLAELRREPRLVELRREPWLHSADLLALQLREEDCGAAIAFTRAGLHRLGVPDDDLQSFVIEFQEGMTAEHRSRLLGDINENAPGAWRWGTGDDLHALLIVFWDPEKWGRANVATPTDKIERIPGRPWILSRLVGVSTNVEPFGFADGMSQPFVEGLTKKAPSRDVRAVKAGEFVLGYINEFGSYPASPSVAMNALARGLLRERADGRADFGRNGSFLVMRQLEQHVDKFKAFIAGDEHLAARMVGRWKNGSDLVRHGSLDGRGRTMRELEAENGFGYHREDRHGFRCPVGAHIRRANPRDALADDAGIPPEEAQALADRHRILRRGRVYRDGAEEGLLFLCLNANIERQFEFVQGTWLMNSEFGGLRHETDPLLGYCADRETRSMTCQHPRMARRVDGLERFVTVRGGAYFFVPGLRAIDYLARI